MLLYVITLFYQIFIGFSNSYSEKFKLVKKIVTTEDSTKILTIKNIQIGISDKDSCINASFQALFHMCDFNYWLLAKAKNSLLKESTEKLLNSLKKGKIETEYTKLIEECRKKNIGTQTTSDKFLKEFLKQLSL